MVAVCSVLGVFDDNRNDAGVIVTNQSCHSVGEHEPIFRGRSGKNRRIISCAKADIGHAHQIKLRSSPQEAAHDRATEVLINEQFYATCSVPALRASRRA